MKTESLKLEARKELEKVLGFIEANELSQEQKKVLSKDAYENVRDFVNPGWLTYRKSVSDDIAVVEWSDYGVNFSDLNGEEYIDCLGGFGIFTCGHRNEHILKYVKAQLERQAMHSQELIDPLRGYLSKVMAMVTPGDLKYCFFTNGGAEAVEMALKLARLTTGGSYYISALNGFHGKTLGAVSMVGKSTFRKPYLPMIQQVQHVEYGNAEDIRKAIRNLHHVGEKVAAVILEPVQGEGGVVIPPPGYLKEVRQICDEYGVVMILDEIQTGMGRTGTLFRCEAEDVVPDIMTYGKAFGGGILPITGIIARPHLWTEEIIENPWILGSPTFGGNPLCCSAALATLNYMLEYDIPGQAKAKGEYFMEKFKYIKEKYSDLIQDVRGVGLMMAIEFKESEVGYEVVKGLFKRKVMTAGTLNNSKCVRIQPAATMPYETIDIFFEHLVEALEETILQLKGAVS